VEHKDKLYIRWICPICRKSLNHVVVKGATIWEAFYLPSKSTHVMIALPKHTVIERIMCPNCKQPLNYIVLVVNGKEERIPVKEIAECAIKKFAVMDYFKHMFRRGAKGGESQEA